MKRIFSILYFTIFNIVIPIFFFVTLRIFNYKDGILLPFFFIDLGISGCLILFNSFFKNGKNSDLNSKFLTRFLELNKLDSEIKLFHLNIDILISAIFIMVPNLSFCILLWVKTNFNLYCISILMNLPFLICISVIFINDYTKIKNKIEQIENHILDKYQKNNELQSVTLIQFFRNYKIIQYPKFSIIIGLIGFTANFISNSIVLLLDFFDSNMIIA